MHLESVRKTANRPITGQAFARQSAVARDFADPKELEEIFVRTYGPIRRDRQGVGRVEKSFHRAGTAAGEKIRTQEAGEGISSGRWVQYYIFLGGSEGAGQGEFGSGQREA